MLPPKEYLILSLYHGLYYNYYFFKYLFIYLFIYLWLRWVFIDVRGIPLVVASGGYSSLRCAGFSLWWLVFVAEHWL